MGSENQEKFQLEYGAGKAAFDRGEYRVSVEHLETATQLVSKSSPLGGEVQIWLVTAYQAANQEQDAIALCETLLQHPRSEIRQQSQRLLYIIRAPRLKRPDEWMSKIPDLGTMSESTLKNRYGSRPSNGSLNRSVEEEQDPIDLSQVDTQDNQFVGIALITTILICLGLWWLS